MDKQMKKIRKEIDKIDNGIVRLLKKRLNIVRKMGVCKKNNNYPIKDNKREREIILKIRKKAQNKIEEKYIKSIFKSVIKNSRRVQR